MPSHYCILRREKQAARESAADLAYREARQRHFVEDLWRYRIHALMVDEYTEITEILRDVENQYKSNTVFFSGSAREYGARWTPEEALDFLHCLGMQIIRREFRIVTGLGFGIGNAIVNGALDTIYREQKGKLDDQLLIRPFPRAAKSDELWTSYREELLGFAGIAIFAFGNRIEGTPPALLGARGVMEEFEIARRLGVKVLPLGFTGYTALEIYRHVRDRFDEFYPAPSEAFRAHFVQLGDPALTRDELLRATLDALAELQQMKPPLPQLERLAT